MKNVVAAIIKVVCALTGGFAGAALGAWLAVAILKLVTHHPWDTAHGDDNWVMSVGFPIVGAVGLLFGWRLGSKIAASLP